MKKITFLLLALFTFSFSFSQDHFILDFVNDNSNQGFYDNTTTADLVSSGQMAAARRSEHTTAGRNNLGDIRRWIAQEVFIYLESVVKIPVGLEVDVEFTSYSFPNPAGDNAVGVAFDYLLPSTIDDFAPTVAQKKIVDNLQLTSEDPNGTAADMRFYINFVNFDDEFGVDFETGIPPGGVDLFSVILHEAVHGLGFGSNIASDVSAAGSGDYSVFDELLNLGTNQLLPGGDPTGRTATNLISENINIDVHGKTMDVYSRDPFQDGTSLSHILSSEFASNHVMEFSVGANQTTRELSREERAILCAMGYSLKGNARNAPFGCLQFPLAEDDNYTYTPGSNRVCYNVINGSTAGTGVDINATKIDVNFGDLETPGLEVDGDIEDIGLLEVSGGEICFLPNSDFCGTVLLRYRAANDQGVIGSVGTVTITVPCLFDPDNPCSFIANGGFERGRTEKFLASRTDINAFDDPDNNQQSFVDNWWGEHSDLARLSPAVATNTRFLSIGITAPATYNGSPDNQRFAAIPNQDEHIVTRTLRPLTASVSYRLEFQNYIMENSNASSDQQVITVMASTSPDLSTAPLQVGQLTYDRNASPPLAYDNWETVAFNFTPFTTANYYFFFINDNTHTNTRPQFIDDVVLTPDEAYELRTDVDLKSVRFGDQIQLTRTITNTGTVSTNDIVVTTTLPSELALASGSPALVRTISSMAANAVVTETLIFDVVSGDCSIRDIVTGIVVQDAGTGNPRTNQCADNGTSTDAVRIGGDCACNPPVEEVTIQICDEMTQLDIVPNATNPWGTTVAWQIQEANGTWLQYIPGTTYTTTTFAANDRITFVEQELHNGTYCIFRTVIYTLAAFDPYVHTEEFENCDPTTTLDLTDVLPNAEWTLNGSPVSPLVMSPPATGVYIGKLINNQGCLSKELQLKVSCEDCKQESNGHLIAQLRYPMDNNQLFTVSTVEYDNILFTLSKNTSNGDLIISRYDKYGNNLSAWSYEPMSEQLTVKDLWVGKEGIYILGDVSPQPGARYSDIPSSGYFIARIGLDGTFDWLIHNKGDIAANAFAPTFSDDELSGFLVTGGSRHDASQKHQNALIARHNAQGEILFTKEITLDITCGNCEYGEELVFGYDISNQIDESYPYYAILLVTRKDNIHPNQNGASSKFGFVLVDIQGNIHATNAGKISLWSASNPSNSLEPKCINTDWDGNAHIHIAGGYMQGKSFALESNSDGLMQYAKWYNTEEIRDLAYDGLDLLLCSDMALTRVHRGSLVVTSTGYNKFNYPKQPIDNTLAGYYDASKRTKYAILESGQVVLSSNRDAAPKLTFVDINDNSMCTDALNPLVATDLGPTLISMTPGLSDVTYEEKTMEMCHNNVDLRTECCYNDLAVPIVDFNCDFNFTFGLSANGVELQFTGLEGPQLNTQVAISGPNGYSYTGAVPSGEDLDMPYAGKYSVCVTKTNSEGCTKTVCKCIEIKCDPLDFDFNVVSTGGENYVIEFPSLNPNITMVIIHLGNGQASPIMLAPNITDFPTTYGCTYDPNNGQPLPCIYTICIEVTYGNDCKETVCKTIDFGPMPQGPMITLNQDETDHRDDENLGSITSINNTKSETGTVVLFPNPSENGFTLKTSGHWIGQNQLQIYDASGKLILGRSNVGSYEEYDLSHLPDGIYTVRLLNNTGTWHTKFVKLKSTQIH